MECDVNGSSGPVAGLCEYGSEHSDSVAAGETTFLLVQTACEIHSVMGFIPWR
jgi:hypothetical protein